MPTARILLVEDDHELRDLLARGLRRRGYELVSAADGDSALRSAAVEVPDAVVLDIGLPDSDGRDVCQALRSRGIDAPVLFLTARGDLHDRLSGFAAGGDDYLAKPFALDELVARLGALLRRHVNSAPAVDGVRIDPVRHCLAHDDREVALSPIELKLLARLLADPGAVVRRSELRAAAWPAGAIVADNTLDQYVTKLRRKLAEVGAPDRLASARGVGFRIVRD
ncbi:response regulator transcription factor [Jatrophihabitans fulvus]